MSTPNISPLAPAGFPDMPAIAGVRIATHACGMRYRGRDDVLLVELAVGTAVAGVFTRSATATAEVGWCRTALSECQGSQGSGARALLVNAGNANAFTGCHGEEAVRRIVRATAALIGCSETQVFRAATGVIGERLPDEKITAALAFLFETLRPGAWETAARAIMTTDTFDKGCTRGAPIDVFRRRHVPKARIA